MDKNAAKILVVFFNAVIKLLDLGLGQKTQDPFFQLSAALAGDDLNRRDPFVNGLLDDPIELNVDRMPLIENIMKIYLDPGHSNPERVDLPNSL